MQSNAAADSLNKRYFYKLFSNFIGFIVSVVIQAIIPRGLGPKAYGNFNFLTSFFSQITSFLDSGTSTCFYTKLSSRQNEFGLVSFYFYFILAAFLLIIGFVFAAFLFSAHNLLWPAQENIFIYLALGFAILTWIAQVLNSMTDARGLTVSAELTRVLQKIFGVAFIIILFVSHRLNLRSLFLYHYVMLFLCSSIFILIMHKYGYSVINGWKLTWQKTKAYIKEFYNYSHPLFIYSLLALIVGIFDRWLLQIVGGSLQQGFYSLSYQIGAICFLFAGAMTPLIMREFSIAYEKKNLNQIVHLFQRYVPLLYAITAYLSCFVVTQASKVVYIFGGNRFREAIIPVSIMAFYPIHQVYGQLVSSVFYATGKTKLYSSIAIIFMLVGLPLTYFLLAPNDKFGLNAGANGLATKMVLINFMDVNVQFYFVSRILNLNFWRYFGHQLLSIGAFLSVAVGASSVIDYIFKSQLKSMPSFFITGILYSLLVMCLIYAFPFILGVKRGDFGLAFQILSKKLNFKFIN